LGFSVFFFLLFFRSDLVFVFLANDKAVFQILVTDELFWLFQFRRKLKTDLHGLPMWILWLCCFISNLQVTFLFLQAFLLEIGYDQRSLKIVFSRGLFSFRLQFMPSMSF